MHTKLALTEQSCQMHLDLQTLLEVISKRLPTHSAQTGGVDPIYLKAPAGLMHMG